MKPDYEDANNHVPEISPDDEWDDFDEVVESTEIEQTPSEPERGFPQKKVARGPVVNRHEPRLRVKQEAVWGDEAAVEENEAVRVGLEKVTRKDPKPKEVGVNGPVKELPKFKSTETLEEPEAGDFPVGTEGGGEIPIGVPFQAQKTVENEGDAARMRRRFVRGERVDWGEGDTSSSNRWIVYMGLVVVVLVVLAVFLSQLSGSKAERAREGVSYGDPVPEKEEKPKQDNDLGNLQMLTSGQQEAKEIYGKYMTAATTADLSGLVYNPEEVLPLLEKSFTKRSSPKNWIPGEETQWTVVEEDGVQYGVLVGMDPDYARFAAFFRKVGDGLKLDWKATEGYGTASFEELNAGKGDGSGIRAIISRSDFYTFSLPEGKFRSFRLMSPDSGSNLWGYTEVGSDVDEKLLKIFVPSQITGEARNEVQVQLNIAPGPEDALPNQWMIRELLRQSWLDGLKE